MAESSPDLRAIGDRIQQLLDELQSSTDENAWLRVEEVVRLVTELYGAGLARILDLAADDALVNRLAGDDLVASLLLIHDLHPDGFASRVARAVDAVAPGIRARGGDVDVVTLDAEQRIVEIVVTATGSGCGSTGPALRDAVSEAVNEAAPDASWVDVSLSERTEPTITPVQLRRKPAGSRARADA